jgi:flagellar basal body-associated protein FliL
MIINLLIILITLLILTFLVSVNLLVIIVSTQSKILQSKQEVFRAIQDYLDLLPEFVHSLGVDNQTILREREAYLLDPTWDKYIAMEAKIKLNIPNLSDSKLQSKLKDKYTILQAALHNYNSQVIKYKQMLLKKRYKYIKLLDFRYGLREYQELVV